VLDGVRAVGSFLCVVLGCAHGYGLGFLFVGVDWILWVGFLGRSCWF